MIDEDQVQKAFDDLRDYANAAKARATRLYLEDYKDHLIGILISEQENVPATKAKEVARGDPRYLQHLKMLRTAVERDEWYRGRRALAEALVEGWRTASANERGTAKI